MASGLKSRIGEMQGRLERLEDRSSKRRQIARDVMEEIDLKKIVAPDFTVSIRPGSPALVVVDESAIPGTFFEPREPRLNRQALLAELKGGAAVAGARAVQSGPCAQREDQVMGFSQKQVSELGRSLDADYIRTREVQGRTLSYIEGWHAIAEANRIFGFDGWDRETVESRCVIGRDNRRQLPCRLCGQGADHGAGQGQDRGPGGLWLRRGLRQPPLERPTRRR